MKLTLEITGPVAIGGHRPGTRFEIEAFECGTPVDRFWRKRLADEATHNCGAVRVVTPETAPPSADDTPAPSAPSRPSKRTTEKG
jgi:hypothetical protein